jgi:hypothetical protein
MKIFRLGSMAMVAAAAPVAAQVHLETGGGTAHLDQLPISSLTSILGGVDATLGRTTIQFTGHSEEHFGLGAAGEASGAVHYQFTPGPWRIDVGPVSEVARGIGQEWSGTLAGDLHAERDLGPFTIRAGWQAGRAEIGSEHSAWQRPSIGAELRVGTLALETSWQNTAVNDNVLGPAVLVAAADIQSDTLYRGRLRDIQDVSVRAAWTGGDVSVSGRAGRRYGTSVTPQTWWEGHFAYQVTPMMAVTFNTGRLAADELLTTRGGAYTTVGVRLDLMQRTSTRSAAAANGALAEVVRDTPAIVHLYFVLPANARRATLASDLTEWKSVQLRRTGDGRWDAALPAIAGVHRVNIRFDNGPWRAPEGLPATDDGFGTKVGLIVVEP